MELTIANVQAVLDACRFKRGEDPGTQVKAEGAMKSYLFNQDRLKNHQEDIENMLGQLPETFKQDSGGGWHFMYATKRADHVKWGSLQAVDRLLCLGIAIGKARTLMPRDMWHVFPGGLPYFVVV